MKISPICPSCLLGRVYYEARFATMDEELISRCVDEALKILATRFAEKPINAHLATTIHRRVYEILGCKDPYAEVKKRANRIASESLDEVQKLVENYSRKYGKFRASVIASIVGNNFDYGVAGHNVVEEDVIRYFAKMMKIGLKIDDCNEIESLCHGRVVYLTDNAGEIFFDRILMNEIKKRCERLSVVVRGRPIISDATVEDAVLAGIDSVADEILTNGKGAIGIIIEELPDDTLDRLENSDVIVAKGMANYECLSDDSFRRFGSIAFLLTAKCEPVARDIGVEVGDMVAKLSRCDSEV
jgi:hypothetical protein